MKNIRSVLSMIVMGSILCVNVAPVFAIGEISSPVVTEPAPQVISEPAPEPVVTEIEIPPAQTTIVPTRTDMVAPVILESTTTPINSTEIHVTWFTDEPVTSQIEYGSSTTYGSLTTLNTQLETRSAQTISGLTAQTEYHYRLLSHDAAGNVAISGDNTFTTLADTTIAVTPTNTTIESGIVETHIDPTSVTIEWVTDEPTTTEVSYGTTSSLGTSTGVDTTLTTTHSETITNLTPGTEYQFEVVTTDAQGNRTSSALQDFTTLIRESTDPTISSIEEIPTSNAAQIIWETDEPATSEIHYGLTAQYGSETVLNPIQTETHAEVISNLLPDTTYHFEVISTDVSGNITTSPDQTITTTVGVTVAEDHTAPQISDVTAASLLSTNTTIVWSTDEFAVSSLEYGATERYGSRATVSASALLAHSVLLTNLIPNTTYHYCIHATDVSQNISTSCSHTFTTPSETTTVLHANPPIITEIIVEPISPTSVTVTWETSEVSEGEIHFGTERGNETTIPVDSTLSLDHAITLTHLEPNTTYHFEVVASDEIGNELVSTDNLFTTGGSVATPEVTTLEPVTSAPNTSMVIATPIIVTSVETAEITNTAAVITWHTNIPTESEVIFGNTESLEHTSVINTTLTTNHVVTLEGLEPDTNYYFEVESPLPGSSVVTVSSMHEFNTLELPTEIADGAHLIAVSHVASTTEAAITATANKAVTAQIEYGVSTHYGSTSAIATSLQTTHAIILSHLEPDTTYHYRVKVVDASGNSTYSQNYSYTTEPVQISLSSSETTLAPIVENLLAEVRDGSSVELTWDVPTQTSDTSVSYEIHYSTQPITEQNFSSTTDTQSTVITQADVAANGTEREYAIAGLTPGTNYYFAVETIASTAHNTVTSPIVTAELRASASSASSAHDGGSHQPRVLTQQDNRIIPVLPPLVLNATPADQQIILSWQNPNHPSYVRTVIVRNEHRAPNSGTDGSVIYESNGNTFTDTNLTNGKTYHYAIFAYNSKKQFSLASQIRLSPTNKNTELRLQKNPFMLTATPHEHFTKEYKLGMKDVEIEHLQEFLANVEGLYPEKLVTGYFGKRTLSAVKRFQKKFQLPQTGITDEATQTKLNLVTRSSIKLTLPADLALFNTDLKLGVKNAAVKRLQKFLQREGSFTGTLSDVYGPSTVQAVKTFQKKYSIKPISGYFGYKTRHRVRELVGI